MSPLLASLALAQTPAPAPAAPADAPPPDHAIVFSVTRGGVARVGHVLVDADLLAERAKITFRSGEVARTGRAVPLTDGLRVLGLPAGERLVAKAIDTLLYFDTNADGYLDAADPAFAGLQLFVDADGDHRVDAGEVQTFAALGVDNVSRFGSVRMKE